MRCALTIRPCRSKGPMDSDAEASVRPCADGDLWLVHRTLGDPAQMIYLNGPESEDRIQKRPAMFLAMSADPRAGCELTILVGDPRTPASNVGYWECEWQGEPGWEVGWFVLPEQQGRGVATAAMRLVPDMLSKLPARRIALAFPAVDNHPSNAICRKLGSPPRGAGRFRVSTW